MTSILGILLLNFTKRVEAESFGGTTAYTYTAVSANVTKTSSSATTYVNWNSSNQKSHKQWFALYQNGSRKGQGLFNYLTNSAFPGNGSAGSTVHLASQRENIIDPTTYISGTWTP
ncbi:hypothetical protein IGJ19_002533 [Enterococcus sp. DIV1368b]|uniref:Uncharacterized protein n=1 Tax=Enterococcus mundtii TaxID=53346 RepID=A0A1L8V0U9_ENTMU|nr:hypothetical protein [Enterococcus mundtii]MZU11533.1 hypothetical protein [Bifidobacterium longum]GEN18297.1 hypothetical protein LAC02_15780 [Ligilactobacillus acidipiscis]AUB53681.1 hypothetical protein EM4838_12015 [Enterococcus mundtii]NAA00644.1 hypothetical protein [Enterococcus mundtii]NAA03735.1 hypothetical protein [Enterococcus mundtii]